MSSKDKFIPIRERIKERIGIDGKVSPEALQVMYLDEIAGKLSDAIERLLEMGDQLDKMPKVPVGETEDFLFNATASEKQLTFTTPFFAAQINNDGPNGAYFGINKNSSRQAPLLAGEQIAIDLHDAKLKFISFVCDSGNTARLRIFAVR